ncbi:MAG: HEPN domain-containing protein [Chloroflexi bacterium]|nr:HEPN domain-containing protein [Chloroflexota bacterium]
MNDARFLFQGGRHNFTANRAYYGMFRAAQAALAAAGAEPPRTHLGVMGLFNTEYVRKMNSDRRLNKVLQDAFDLKQRSEYGDGDVTRRQAQEAVARAERFVAEVKRLVGA